MKLLPQMQEIPSSRSIVEEFGGINFNDRIGTGEFSEAVNLTTDRYPLLSVRGRRGVLDTGWTETGIRAFSVLNGNILYVVKEDNNKLYLYKQTSHGAVDIIGGNISTNTFWFDDPGGDITIVKHGAYFVIFPLKAHVNSENFEDYGYIDASYETTIASGEVVKLQNCKADGTTIVATVGDTAPGNPEAGDWWIDTTEGMTSTKAVMKLYTDEGWIPANSGYIKVTDAVNYMFDAFSKGDFVSLSGFDSNALHADGIDGDHEVYCRPSRSIAVLATNGFVVGDVGGDGSVILAEGTNLSVRRWSPDMDYVIESKNRLWGCRFGKDATTGETYNEIYASKYGDFKNWQYYAGTSMDSYTESVGAAGKFTGAINYGGYPAFFKEHCIITVSGEYPASYMMRTIELDGVWDGCGGSIVEADGRLIYCSCNGVYSYSGSIPQKISSVFGNKQPKIVKAAYANGKYYGYDGNSYPVKRGGTTSYLGVMWVYDTATGEWQMETDIHDTETAVVQIATSEDRNQVYILAGGVITTEIGREKATWIDEYANAETVKWSATTGIFGLGSPDTKYVSRLSVRLDLAPGARVSFFAQYDSVDRWDHLCTLSQQSLRTVTVPIRIRRCDHLRLRLEGEGDCKIYSITYTTENGSDRQ